MKLCKNVNKLKTAYINYIIYDKNMIFYIFRIYLGDNIIDLCSLNLSFWITLIRSIKKNPVECTGIRKT